MSAATENNKASVIESFEVTKGAQSGDLLSEALQDRPLKIGFLACAYFEYWRMYEGLREKVVGDMQRIASRLSERYQKG